MQDAARGIAVASVNLRVDAKERIKQREDAAEARASQRETDIEKREEAVSQRGCNPAKIPATPHRHSSV